jgi:hypothetical protein
MSQKQLIAFVHIEKAAGTTFTSILQQNYLFRHCAVKTLKKKEKRIFSAESMKIIYFINPFVKSISGHSVMPFSDLGKIVPDIRYVTILRDPYTRYISHYQHQVEKMGSNFSFKDFLNADFTHNFQTLKIAGTPDIEKAIQILNSFFLVGVLEEFDKFLMILQKKLLPRKFDIIYTPKNIAKKKEIEKTILRNMDKYRNQIADRNRLDIELYNYVRNCLFAKEKITYLHSHREEYTGHKKKKSIIFKFKFNMYRIYQKAYYSQMIKIFRFIHGLPSHGSY